MSESEFTKWNDLLARLPDDNLHAYEFYFGTNEALMWSTKADMMSDIVIEDITSEQAATFCHVLGIEVSQTYGLFPITVDQMEEMLEADGG